MRCHQYRPIPGLTPPIPHFLLCSSPSPPCSAHPLLQPNPHTHLPVPGVIFRVVHLAAATRHLHQQPRCAKCCVTICDSHKDPCTRGGGRVLQAKWLAVARRNCMEQPTCFFTHTSLALLKGAILGTGRCGQATHGALGAWHRPTPGHAQSQEHLCLALPELAFQH